MKKQTHPIFGMSIQTTMNRGRTERVTFRPVGSEKIDITDQVNTWRPSDFCRIANQVRKLSTEELETLVANLAGADEWTADGIRLIAANTILNNQA